MLTMAPALGDGRSALSFHTTD